MAKKIFITATNTNIGKTYATKLLLEHLAKKGLKVGVIKPIESGVTNEKQSDAYALFELVKKLNPDFSKLNLDDISPIKFKQPASPFVANNAKDIDMKLIEKKIKKLEKICDILLIEGVGGTLVPLDKHYNIQKFIKHLNAHAILITHCNLGCINDTLVNIKALEDIKHIVIFNCKDNQKDFEQTSKFYFDKTNANIMILQKDIQKIIEKIINL